MCCARTRIAHWLACSLLASLVGCQGTFNGFLKPVGPDYCPPAAMLASEWNALSPDARAESPDLYQWWSVFQDPALEELVTTVGAQNLELKAAAARIAEARALLRISRGNWFPQTQESFGSYSREANSINQVVRNNGFQFYDLWQSGMSAAWELDFWGRYRRDIASSEAALASSFYNWYDVHVLLIGEVVANYTRFRVAETRLELARTNVDRQKLAYDTALGRFQAGVTSELDPSQAEANLARTEATLPALEIDRQQALNALCVLLGRPPHAIDQCFALGTGIPIAPDTVEVGIPSELLLRRPDIRRAERDLAAQSERIGIAASDLYPRLSLLGTIGFRANSLSDLLESDSLTGGIGPGFRWNILNYGRIRGAIDAEKAKFSQLCAEYQQTVLTAAQEVEDNLVAYHQQGEALQSIGRSVHATEHSIRLALEQYQVGKTDFDRVFNLQRTLARQQDDLAAVLGQRTESLVRLYTALGGGWMCQDAKSLPHQLLVECQAETIAAATETVVEVQGAIDGTEVRDGTQEEGTQENATGEEENGQGDADQVEPDAESDAEVDIHDLKMVEAESASENVPVVRPVEANSKPSVEGTSNLQKREEKEGMLKTVSEGRFFEWLRRHW